MQRNPIDCLQEIKKPEKQRKDKQMLMTTRRKRVQWALAALAVLGMGGMSLMAGNTATAGEGSNLSPNINDYVANHLDDFTATMKRGFYD